MGLWRLSFRPFPKGLARRGVGLAAACLAVLLVGGQVSALERDVRNRVLQSVVQVVALRDTGHGQRAPLWTGSGTIVSADGLILTNCHVAAPHLMGMNMTCDFLAIGLTTRTDEPPQFTYRAEIVAADPDLDVAVLRIARALDGTPVDPALLNLPAIEMGDSDALEIGDNLYIFGYPGIGGETVTYTRGVVSGFSRRAGIDGRAWIKTDATIAGGNSGGTAVDDEGRLVGIPTRASAGDMEPGEIVDVRPLADTNLDGVVDERDAAVPVGGFINGCRPVNLARRLVDAASQGITTVERGSPLAPERPTPSPTVTPMAARIGRTLFCEAVDEYGQPQGIAEALPSGCRALYLVYDFDGFSQGAVWEAHLSIDGALEPDVWPAERWSGPPSGTSWIGIPDVTLPDGRYRIEILVDGAAAGGAEITVGSAPDGAPRCSSLRLTAGDQTGLILPVGAPSVAAAFDLEGVPSGATVQARWTRRPQGAAIPGATPSLSFAEGSAGTATATLAFPQGLAEGTYRLDVYVVQAGVERLVGTADFIAVGVSSGPRAPSTPAIGEFTFAEGLAPGGAPIRPSASFAEGIRELHAVFDYEGLANGLPVAFCWYVDGDPVFSDSVAWSLGAQGTTSIWIRGDPLPPGEYRLEISIQGTVVREGNARVEPRPRRQPPPAAPPDRPMPVRPPNRVEPRRPPANIVDVRGRVTDANTGRPVPGVQVVVLRPGVDSKAWGGDAADIFAQAQTGPDGYFRLSQGLERGASYSWIIRRQGYQPIVEDAVEVGADLPSPFEMGIEMQRRL